MGAIRRHRTLFAWIATVAVLCNLAAGLSSPALARSAGSDPWPVELLGPQVLLRLRAWRPRGVAGR
jgi:hypothetical protein